MKNRTQVYAFEIKKSDIPLLTFLNGGDPVEYKKPKQYLVFVMEEHKGRYQIAYSEILNFRELSARYDHAKRNPFMFAMRFRRG